MYNTSIVANPKLYKYGTPAKETKTIAAILRTLQKTLILLQMGSKNLVWVVINNPPCKFTQIIAICVADSNTNEESGVVVKT